MNEAVAQVVAGPLEAGAWAPFGWLPVDDTDPQDERQHLTFTWGDPHLNVIAHRPDEVARSGDALRCTEMFRHDTHSQALLVLDSPAVVAVAPAGAVFDGPGGVGSVGSIRAFHLRPGDVVVLHPGTWHWGPFPLGDAPVRLLNLQGRRYREDNARADLEAAGTVVDVIVANGNRCAG